MQKETKRDILWHVKREQKQPVESPPYLLRSASLQFLLIAPENNGEYTLDILEKQVQSQNISNNQAISVLIVPFLWVASEISSERAPNTRHRPNSNSKASSPAQTVTDPSST